MNFRFTKVGDKYTCKIDGNILECVGTSKMEAIHNLLLTLYEEDLELEPTDVYVYKHIEDTFVAISGQHVGYATSRQEAVELVKAKLSPLKIKVQDMT